MNMLTSRIGTTFQNEAQIKSFFYPKWDFYNYFSIQRRIYLRPEFNDREITKIMWKKEKEKRKKDPNNIQPQHEIFQQKRLTKSWILWIRRLFQKDQDVRKPMQT